MKTKPLAQLYHQFLKPKDIPQDKLPLLVTQLYEAQFIELYHTNELPDVEVYVETLKLTNGKHRNELFKIIQQLK